MTAVPQIGHSATFLVPAAHPALAGHFPGNPIVPGVVVLDEVISAAEDWLGARFHTDGLSYAKFLAPLKHDEPARIEFRLNGSLLEFAVYRGDLAISKGTLTGCRESAT